MKNFIIQFYIIISISSSIAILPQTTIPKKTGICFRWDDNSSLSNYSQYFQLFNKYGFKSGLAMNFGNNEFSSIEYRDSIRKYQQQGHEIMDHTPNHRTNYFNTLFNPADYDTMIGVDHRNLNKICLKFEAPNPADTIGTAGVGNISGNIITSVPNSFGPFGTGTSVIYYLYFPSLPADSNLVLIDRLMSPNGSQVRFTNVWNEPVNLGNHTDVQYYTFSVTGIKLTIPAIRALANESKKLATSYGLEPPTTWIQPGITFAEGSNNSVFPNFSRAELKEALTPLGYTQGATYVSRFQEEATLTFNEYDPNEDAQFGMQWGDFSDQGNFTTQNKRIISNYLSDNKVAIGLSHGAPSSWANYVQSLDSLLNWCNNNDIQIKTYKQWADILYLNHDLIPDPFQNVFPQMNTDLDGNDYPDGYDVNGYNYIWNRYVIWDKNDGPPGSNVSAMVQSGSLNTSADDSKFGSIEKGLNDFEIWTKGNNGSAGIRVSFLYFVVDGTYDPIEGPVFTFPANTTYWKRYNLDQSMDEEHTINIPSNVSTIIANIQNINTATNEKVGGLKLLKKGPSLSLVAFLEGPYNANLNIMNNSLRALSYIPPYQPYSSSPWNFNGDTLITNVNDIRNDVVDWVLVELRNKNDFSNIVDRKAALILTNGTVIDPNGISPLTFQVPDDDYYISIRHRNHLTIRSTNTISLSAGMTTFYNFSSAGNSIGGKVIDNSPVVWGMISGDANGNGQIQNNDNEEYWEPQNGLTGYINADYNMDGMVDNNDSLKWTQNNGKATQ